MEKISAPVEALDNASLENVSGGAVEPMELANILAFAYNQGETFAKAVLGPWGENISSATFNATYGTTVNVLNSYNDNKDYTLEEKAEYFAKSWNKLHPNGGTLSVNGAMYLLSIPDIKKQALVAMIPNANDMEKAALNILNGQ